MKRITSQHIVRGRRPATAAKRRRPAAGKAPWYLYILECGDGSLYTGISNNVEKRFGRHCAGKGAKYTRAHLPVKIVYVERCGGQGTAMQREREVKSFPKKKKLKLTANGKGG